MIRGGEVPAVQAEPEPPTLARRIIDLPDEPTHAFIGMVASHFATATTLDRATVERYVDEAVAVSS